MADKCFMGVVRFSIVWATYYLLLLIFFNIQPLLNKYSRYRYKQEPMIMILVLLLLHFDRAHIH